MIQVEYVAGVSMLRDHMRDCLHVLPHAHSSHPPHNQTSQLCQMLLKMFPAKPQPLIPVWDVFFRVLKEWTV